MEKVLVSACLFGENCKYNGGNNYCYEMEFLKKEAILVCPECIGGLYVPRVSSEIQEKFDGFDVVNAKAAVFSKNGDDVTEYFLDGAKKTLKIALENGVKTAYLKQGSPSCGCGIIYSGAFDNTKKQGDGVTTALLKKYGIKVIPVK